NLPFTFYDLYTIGALSRAQDRRQPLPSAFMPRFIQGGITAFNTNVDIWREALAAPTTCPAGYGSNSNMEIAEVVRFDEHENATFVNRCCCILCPPGSPGTSAVMALSGANTSMFPPFST